MKGTARGVAVYGGLLLATVLLFLLFPGLDLAVSRLFHDQQQGFWLADWAPVRAVAAAIPWLVWLLLVLVVAAALWLGVAGRPLWRFDRNALVFIVVATALGPGILANTVLKDHWGRARPSQIAAFGGSRQFTPAPLPAAQCDRNCAFVSGHAALAFAFVEFAFLLPRRRERRAAEAAALAFGALVGLGRIAAGAHFLSDVVYAGFLVYGTGWLLHRWIVERDVLASPAARRLGRASLVSAAAMWRAGIRLSGSPAGRLALWAAAVVVIEAIAMIAVDRPLAWFLHARDPDVHSAFEAIGRLGLAYPYLVLFGLAYAGLRWGGELPGLRPAAASLRRAAPVPGFLFAALAASGLVVDVLKVACGRTRPKLLFGGGSFDFTWLGLRADHWSFPSGHAATVAALMTALWCLWPRHLLFYILLGAIIAASRVVTGAHYLSDVVMGAFVAVVTTRMVAGLIATGRIDIASWRIRRRAEAPPT
ncbi:MAG: phosphatase PAP2 family protein [Alphaproteobacteria bacterium]|nr:phosphatase PAP2 family protein [Alphaproteobacteria bacterium]